MIEEAAREFGIDLRGSFIIGNKMSDIETGCRAGCKTVLLTNKGSPEGEKTASTPHYIAADLYEAVEWLVSAANQG